MVTTSDLVPALFMATFIIAIVFGVIQYLKAKKARDEHHRSADAKAHGDVPTTAGRKP